MGLHLRSGRDESTDGKGEGGMSEKERDSGQKSLFDPVGLTPLDPIACLPGVYTGEFWSGSLLVYHQRVS